MNESDSDSSDREEGERGDERQPRGWRALLVDVTPLKRSPAFARLWVGNSIAQIGAQMTIVAVGLHIFHITHSTLAVALVALWALGPMVIAGFVGGNLADRFDRRLVALITAMGAWASIVAMTVIAFLGVEATWPYYTLAAVNAAASTIMGAARGASIPRLVPTQLLPAAAALNGLTMGFAVTVGPALAGVMVAFVGFAPTYLIDALLFTAAFVGILGLPSLKPEGKRSAPGFGSVIESLRFLRQAPNVRSTFVFDLIAMGFGTVRVVFPAAGALVLGGGAITVGALTASFAAGALISGLVSGPLGRVRYQGRAVTWAIASYGLFIALFGLVLMLTGAVESQGEGWEREVVWPALIVGCLALAGAGASDNVSAVFRTTILQAAAPDEVRGRMQGLFYVVVAGGPRLGDLFAGALATVIALWAPGLIGGLVIVAMMLVALRVARGFQRYDAFRPAP